MSDEMSQGTMDFESTLPGQGTMPDKKSMPHTSTERLPTSPVCAAPGADLLHIRNVRWTSARCARYDHILHIVSLVLGICTLIAYVFDLAKSASYHVKLPVGLTVVDVLSIVFLCFNNVWSLVYFLTGMYARMSRGDLSRKWPAIVDLVLHCCQLSMADTTLAMRSGDSSCDVNRAVGGCLSSRRALIIAAGVLLILVSVAVQLRFYVTMHAHAEHKKLVKIARREAVHGDETLNWSNTIR